VTIDVTDNGPGMAPEILAKVFEPFFTTKGTGEGTGLGLAISQTIVTGAGGTLSVESALGRGTTFRVELPAAVEAEEAAPAAAVAPPRRARVLIIDDEVAIIRSLGALLEGEYDVVMMTSGREAMDALLGGATYDVVLCDLMMPNVTGMDLYEKLAQARPGAEAKLVFMTGGAFTDRARTFLAGIPNPCVEKPFPISELDAIIAKLIA
jgi:CheY-like chemotaxis protein